MHSWNTFGALMNHGQTLTHKTHHSSDLGKTNTFPLIVFSMLGHRACTEMSFCLGTPKLGISKFPKLGLLWFWKPITFCTNLRLRWGLKQSCSPLRKVFKDMQHVTCTQVKQGNSWLFVVGSQIGNLTPDHFFGHSLCFTYPNGSCEPNLNIHISRSFQWYKKLFNPMSFDLYNRPLKIQKSIGTLTPKVGTHLGVCEFIP